MKITEFSALVLRLSGGVSKASVETLSIADLPAGDVLLRVDYSSLNYKDALAVTGKGKIARSFPMIPGIDLAGTVVESASMQYKPGDQVVLTGWGVGEQYWGGYSQYQRVNSEWLVPLPPGLDARRAMAIGTAGFTAMLCVLALEDAGVTPQSGRILVTGASGGVGSVAIAILAKLGFQVTALIAPEQVREAGYVQGLGATEVIWGSDWSVPPKPLEAQKWAAAIDVVGGNVLARLLSEMQYGGAVAACGLAGGTSLSTTVMPFILRGVRLLGVDSVMCPGPERLRAWQRVVMDLPAEKQGQLTAEISMLEIFEHASLMLEGKTRGRTVISMRNSDGDNSVR
jgi:acrylyl-CoA reductase (NADPH)